MSDQDFKERAGFMDRWSARKRSQTAQSESDPLVAGSTVNLESAHASPMTVSDSDTEAGTNLGTENEQNPTSDADTQSAQISSEAAAEQEPLLSDEDMPPIPSLTAKSDLSAFFNKGVSAGLRRAALRHVFQLPVYNVRDGLNDYDDDFTKFEPLGDTITSDMKWHKARKEREAEERAAELKAREEKEREEKAAQELEEAEAEHPEEQAEQSEHAESQQEADATNSDGDQAQSNQTQDDQTQDGHPKSDHTQDNAEPSESRQSTDSSTRESEMNTEQESEPVESDATGAPA